MTDNVADVTVKDNTLVVESNGSAAPFVVTVKDGVCHVAVLATNGKPFATVKVIDKATGNEVPVNVYTCAEAVVCNAGIPMQVHLQNLYGHAEDEGAHLTAEQKAGLETKKGAQDKADKAKQEAITVASLMIEKATHDSASDSTQKAESAMTDAYKYTDQLRGDLGQHMQNKANPHGVTAEQVGLGNVPNKSTNDLQPTYTASASLSPLASGERLAVAFGKISKAIASLISHIANYANPHRVTASQAGAVPTTGGTMTGTLKMDGGYIVLKRGVNYGTEDEIPANLPDGAFWLKVVG